MLSMVMGLGGEVFSTHHPSHLTFTCAWLTDDNQVSLIIFLQSDPESEKN